MTAPMLVSLGIDVGSSNTKVVLADVAASTPAIVVSTAEPTPTDGTELVRVVQRLVRAALREAGDRGVPDPVAVGIASMAETGLLVGADDRPLTPLIRWNALPTGWHASRLVSDLGTDEFGRQTGLPALPKVPLLVWERLRESEPALWRPEARWSGVADLIALVLTGELRTDHTLAARTGALTGSVGPSGAFDEEMLARVGVSPAQLPRIVAAGDAAGRVSRSAAADFGIPAETPVYIAGHDHAVGAWAAGVREPGQVADSLGTAEALIRVARHPVDRVAATRAGMSVSRTVCDDRDAVMAGASGAGALVAAWSAELDLPAADLLDSRPTGVLVLPYLSGRQTPSPDPDARVLVIGDAATTGIRTRALFEGLALHARWMFEEQCTLTGAGFEQPIRVLGGPGARGGLWLGIKGAVYPVPSRRVLCSEPVATGAALLAATRMGAAAGGALDSEPLAPPDLRFDPVFDDFVAAARRQQKEHDVA